MIPTEDYSSDYLMSKPRVQTYSSHFLEDSCSTENLLDRNIDAVVGTGHLQSLVAIELLNHALSQFSPVQPAPAYTNTL